MSRPKLMQISIKTPTPRFRFYNGYGHTISHLSSRSHTPQTLTTLESRGHSVADIRNTAIEEVRVIGESMVLKGRRVPDQLLFIGSSWRSLSTGMIFLFAHAADRRLDKEERRQFSQCCVDEGKGLFYNAAYLPGQQIPDIEGLIGYLI